MSDLFWSSLGWGLRECGASGQGTCMFHFHPTTLNPSLIKLIYSSCYNIGLKFGDSFPNHFVPIVLADLTVQLLLLLLFGSWTYVI